MELVLALDAGDRLVLEQVAHVLGGEAPGLELVALAPGLLHGAQLLLLLAGQLRDRESVLADPLGLGEQGLETAVEAVVLDAGGELDHLLGAHRVVAAGEGPEEGRLGLGGQLVEAPVEHAVVEALDQALPVGAPGRVVARVLLVHDADDVGRGLRVGDDGEEGFLVIGHRRLGPHRGLCRGRHPPQVLGDQTLHVGGLEVAHGDEAHQVRPVPAAVEPADRVVMEGVEDRLLADGDALGVPGVGEEHGQLLVEHAQAGALAAAPLLDDDAPLLVDLLAVEGDAVGPVLEDLEGLLHHLHRVEGHGELVHGLVEAGVGVEVGPGAQSHRLEVGPQLLLLEVGGAVESHVLGEVGQPLLLVGLQNRAHVEGQTQLGPVLGLGVGPDDVAQAVVEGAEGDLGIDGKHGVLAVRSRLGGGPGGGGSGGAAGDREAGGEKWKDQGGQGPARHGVSSSTG